MQKLVAYQSSFFSSLFVNLLCWRSDGQFSEVRPKQQENDGHDDHVDEFELLTRAARIITPVNRLGRSACRHRSQGRLATVLALLLDLFLNCLDFILLFLDHTLDLLDLVLQ